MGLTDAVDVVLDVCDELANAHANGVVHGDLGLHRVRTVWPRVAGQAVDIFALGEDDSAAFAFRAAAVPSVLVSPEQRQGRAVDARADVWAVGALLHCLIAGKPPQLHHQAGAIARALHGAPRALVAMVESCLEVEPAKRPQSIDAIAEAIASFSASPPERFEQIVRRRSLLQASVTRKDLADVDRVLGRLDERALEREVTAASFAGPLPTEPPSAPPQVLIGRLEAAVSRGAPAPNPRPVSSVFPAVTAPRRLPDNDGGVEAQTRVAAEHYEAGVHEPPVDGELTRPQPIPSMPKARPPQLVPVRKGADARTAAARVDAVVARSLPAAPPPSLVVETPRAEIPIPPAARPSTKPRGAKLDDLDDLEAETVLAQPPLSIAPVVLSSELFSPPNPQAEIPLPTSSVVVPSAPSFPTATAPMPMSSSALPVPATAMSQVAPTSTRRPWVMALMAVGAVAAIALGVGIGMNLMGRAHAPSTTSIVATKGPAFEKPNANAKPAVHVEKPAEKPAENVITPASLPDARSAEGAKIATPASLPDAPIARPAPVVRPRPSSASSPAEPASGTPADVASASALSDPLR